MGPLETCGLTTKHSKNFNSETPLSQTCSMHIVVSKRSGDVQNLVRNLFDETFASLRMSSIQSSSFMYRSLSADCAF